jgi:hypothetical protein
MKLARQLNSERAVTIETIETEPCFADCVKLLNPFCAMGENSGSISAKHVNSQP